MKLISSQNSKHLTTWQVHIIQKINKKFKIFKYKRQRWYHNSNNLFFSLFRYEELRQVHESPYQSHHISTCMRVAHRHNSEWHETLVKEIKGRFRFISFHLMLIDPETTRTKRCAEHLFIVLHPFVIPSKFIPYKFYCCCSLFIWFQSQRSRFIASEEDLAGRHDTRTTSSSRVESSLT